MFLFDQPVFPIAWTFLQVVNLVVVSIVLANYDLLYWTQEMFQANDVARDLIYLGKLSMHIPGDVHRQLHNVSVFQEGADPEFSLAGKWKRCFSMQ